MKDLTKFILYIIIFTNAIQNMYGQCNEYKYKYDSTVNMIYTYCTINNYPSINDLYIAKNIYDIVYASPDSCISLEDKLDILTLLRKYHRYATIEYRNLILNNQDTCLIENNLLFLLPFVTCEHCTYKTLSKHCNTLNINNIIKTHIPESYKKYYNVLICKLSEKCQNTNKDANLSIIVNVNLDYMIVNTKRFRNKFSKICNIYKNK